METTDNQATVTFADGYAAMTAEPAGAFGVWEPQPMVSPVSNQ